VQLVGEDERLSVTVEPHLDLTVTQEVTEVDMQEGAGRVLQHEVARVPVSDAEDVSCHALTGQGVPVSPVVGLESTIHLVLVFGLGELVSGRHLSHEVVDDASLSEWSSPEALTLVHVGDDI